MNKDQVNHKIFKIITDLKKIYFVIPVIIYILGFIYCQAMADPLLKNLSFFKNGFDGLLPFSQTTYLTIGTKYLGIAFVQFISAIVIITIINYSLHSIRIEFYKLVRSDFIIHIFKKLNLCHSGLLKK